MGGMKHLALNNLLRHLSRFRCGADILALRYLEFENLQDLEDCQVTQRPLSRSLQLLASMFQRDAALAKLTLAAATFTFASNSLLFESNCCGTEVGGVSITLRFAMGLPVSAPCVMRSRFSLGEGRSCSGVR
jgi:hypothetical protein